MSLDDAIERADIEAERQRLLVEKLRGELAASRAHARQLANELEQNRTVAEFLSTVRRSRPPRWLTRRTKRDEQCATVCTIWSDSHWDEVVNPAEVQGLNAYDRAIATQRFERYIDGIEYLAREHLNGVTYDGLVLALGGDLVSGNIHEELRETNEAPIPETIAYWAPLLASGIRHLAETFGRVHVPVVVGNHGRLTRKPRAKLRARDSYDYLLGRLAQQLLADDARITWDIPESADATFEVYGTRFVLTHGDQTTGGSGIGGIWPGIMRLRARKLARQNFDWLVMGHFHQYVHSQGLIVNGSAKGFDEYAALCNFAPEPAQQALWIVTPERGVTWAAPVFVTDRKAEGW